MNVAVDPAKAAAAVNAPAQKTHNGVMMNADLTQRPYFVDGCDTLPKLFAKRCADLGARTAHREKHLGVWQSFSWNDYWEHARLIGLALRALGLKRGDVVSILSEDRKEWLYADFGIQGVGGIVSGVYTTDSPNQLAYLVQDSGSRFLFVENDEHLDKWLEVRDLTPTLEKVIVFDREGLYDFKDDKVLFMEDLYDLGAIELKKAPALFDEEIGKSKPEDIALLIYTSGTTGAPKGAMLSQSNAMFAISAALQGLETARNDELLCFLPLCHVYERLGSAWLSLGAGATVNFAESTETVFDNMREVSPTLFAAVPRVYEKVYSRISIMNNDATWFGRTAYRLALAAGDARARAIEAGKTPSLLTSLSHRFWDWAVLANIRRMLGMERVRRATSGAAPISPELLRWYRAIGVPIFEAYGQTENAAIATGNLAGRNRTGTVGPAMPGLEIRLSPEGEIQTRSGGVFVGYWGKPDKTAETMTPDGFLRTGDVGAVDADGYWRITGRIKDIIITAGGKNITPAEIENKLKFSPYVSDAVVIGDRRAYLTCLIMIDQENVEKFAQDNRVPFNDYASLCAAEPVKELIKGVVDEVNKDFARVEQIKDFRIIDVLLTAEDDELTATMKLKRGFVEKKYAGLIAQMYGKGG
jgi:long-chain acyl-CoA synthetase